MCGEPSVKHGVSRKRWSYCVSLGNPAFPRSVSKTPSMAASGTVQRHMTRCAGRLLAGRSSISCPGVVGEVLVATVIASRGEVCPVAINSAAKAVSFILKKCPIQKIGPFLSKNHDRLQ